MMLALSSRLLMLPLIPSVLTGCALQQLSAPTITGAPNTTASIKPVDIEINFTRNKILNQRVAGDAGVAGRPVSATDPVRIASVSKFVVGIAVMRLVDQGKLDLDRDVGEYLKWPVRNPAFPDQKITLRMLMAHLSSLTDNADYILPLDGDLRAVLADPKAWDTTHAPGQYFRYTNFNLPVIAATMESVTGERFDSLMDRLVLRPIKLDACYNWSAGCSANRRSQAVTLLRPNGDLAKDAAIAVGQTDCYYVRTKDGSCDIARYRLGLNGSAFSPQGGLRISAADLTKVGQLMLNKGAPLLSPKSYAEMTKAQWRFNGSNGADENGYFTGYGLEVHLLKDKQGTEWIGHVGEAYSMRAGFWLNPASGKGRVRYVTMVDEFAKVGHCFDVCP
jgi:CubicO group peptidase (beta-lactamase class C family)